MLSTFSIAMHYIYCYVTGYQSYELYSKSSDYYYKMTMNFFGKNEENFAYVNISNSFCAWFTPPKKGTYSFKLRLYNIKDGKKVYTGWSKVRSVTVK